MQKRPQKKKRPNSLSICYLYTSAVVECVMNCAPKHSHNGTIKVLFMACKLFFFFFWLFFFYLAFRNSKVSPWVGLFTTLVQTETPQQVRDGLPRSHLVQTFMHSCRSQALKLIKKKTKLKNQIIFFLPYLVM